MDTFVEGAKVQREINKKQIDLDLLLANQRSSRIFSIIENIRRSIMVIVPLVVVWVWWSTPIIKFERDYFYPASKLLSFPGHDLNCIGIVAWVTICSIISSQLISLWEAKS